MPDAIITSTESTFGTISGTFAADQSTVTGTITGIITGTLDGSVGVPGLGVPDGGTTGQVLQKATNTSYDTVWATPSGGAWGTITGTLSNQTDLQTALNLKAPLASPALTGVPTAPTAATLTSTTQLATTAFVQQELLSGTANARNLEVYVRNQTGSTLPAGTIVYINGATGNRPTITLAQANNDANSAQTFGFVKTAIANNGFGFVIVRGELENIDTSALTEGVQLYLSPTTAGTWTTTKPSAPQHLVYVGIVVRAHPTQGVILVAVQNGYELEELHDVSIASVANNNLLAYESSTDLWKNKTFSALGLLTSADAASTYLTSATAASTYQTLAGMSSYLTTSAAASTYATKASPTFTGLSVFNNSGNYAISIDNSAGYYTSVSSGVYSIVDAAVEVIRLSAGGIKYPDGVTQSVAYPGASGFLLKADNLSGLANTGTARTNLGLGTMATETASNYLTTASAASTYAPLASPALTGNPTAPTPLTADNDTSIATTAFVKAQGYLTSAPVTSVAGKTGAVTLVVGDVSGAAPLASPALTGTPTAPTAAAATNTTQIATTAFVTTADNLKANLASPTFTGTPAAPTATAGTNTTQIATTAFVTTGLNLKANLASPTFTGTPLSTTAAADTNTTQIATTAFVVGQAGSATPLVNGTAAVGTSLRYARQDHVHGTDTTRAPLASPAFTGTPSLPTGTTAVTQTAGNNTTAVATTAFVQQEVPAASTTAAGKVELATRAEVIEPTSNTLAVTPFQAIDVQMHPGYVQIAQNNSQVSTTTAGAGAGIFTTSMTRVCLGPNTATAGSVYYRPQTNGGVAQFYARGNANAIINFSKKFWMSGRSCFDNTFIGDANNTARVTVGKAATGAGALAQKGIGWQKAGGSTPNFFMLAHNGTTLTSINTGTSLSSLGLSGGAPFDWSLYSDGSGNVTMWINDVQVATTSSGPTGNSNGSCVWQEEVDQTASAATRMYFTNFSGHYYHV
jgi:hypothetical protein